MIAATAGLSRGRLSVQSSHNLGELARLDRGGGRPPVLKKFARDGSALISGLRKADGLIEIAENITE